MLKVRRDLCLGCGLCGQNCPQGAISLSQFQAEIDQRRCNSCGICVEVCPQGAIVDKIPLSPRELKTLVASLSQQTDDIMSRIESLRARAKD